MTEEHEPAPTCPVCRRPTPYKVWSKGEAFDYCYSTVILADIKRLAEHKMQRFDANYERKVLGHES